MSRSLPPDDPLRALHAQALDALSPATLARLRSGRHAAVRPRTRRAALWLASAGAATAVLALGLGLGLRMQDAAPPAIAPMVAVLEDSSGALDENPDLYLWLGDTNLALE